MTDVTVVLNSQERRQMYARCADIAARLARHSLDDPQVLVEAEVAGCEIPPRLIRALAAFRQQGNSHGSLLIRGMPVDENLGPTPPSGNARAWTDVPVATMAQLIVASRLGDVISFADEKEGRLVQDVIPVRGAADRQENTGTSFMELHTEDGFHPFKPDFVTLLCLRSDHDGDARTVTGSARRIVSKLSADSLEVLRQPQFRIRIASSFAAGGTVGHSQPLAVLSGPSTDPDLVADFHAMEPLTEPARRALDEFAAVVPQVVIGAVLAAGEMLVVDNRISVHGRSGFRARHDGHDRWLRRCFAVVDLRRSRAYRTAGSRVCAPLTTITADMAREGRPAAGAGAL
ncbi:TauD/TfdA family dioxygenase [Plantactinospora veratri]|uniref:TauD/TfdA family dioxygenase n=1 Tax=Plantactinospora veratri TaxID=1436122 RepID=A0ABU7S8C6_9ACTN